MSDEALNWDDFGGEEQESKLLPAGEYTGTITAAMWSRADWAAKKLPESGGRILQVKVEIDAPAGYAEAWVKVPCVKDRRWQYRQICGAAGVPAPEKGGPAWSPACLLGKRVQVETSIYTNERTGDSRVQIDRWLEGAVQEPAKPAAARTPKQKVEAAGQGGANDDIPF